MDRTAAVGGDFSELYDALSGTLYGLALRLCETPELAEKVCSQVFVHLYHHGSEHDATRMTVMQWATQLTHRFALLSAVDERATEERAAELLDADNECSELSGDQRHDLANAYFGGLTYREIARHRGADPNQVCVALSGALQHFRHRQAAGR
ncbi:hypothetical protein OHA18_26185 [Kribbella sp. NBC_00709]|uniref:hypothetical protein n=1 Tax=Kribbella sp. NBC_00709 TaxID=2975972 RepID=UPI002E28C00F|nr:hypothetical protein [Kribbella sp. NBC_00709]